MKTIQNILERNLSFACEGDLKAYVAHSVYEIKSALTKKKKCKPKK